MSFGSKTSTTHLIKMSFQLGFIILCSVLVLQTYAIEIASSKPFDLLDDALDALDSLAETVLGNILVAQDELANLSFDVASHSTDVELNAEIDILQEELTLEEQVSSLKSLALAADKNISSCLIGYEDRLKQLPAIYRTQISECITDVQDEGDQILIDSYYAIDVIMSKVQALNFTLGQCSSDDDVCISGVIEKIQTAVTDLPLEIGAEVNSAQDSFDIVKVKIQNCADTAIADYVQEGSDIVSQITECVSKILS